MKMLAMLSSLLLVTPASPVRDPLADVRAITVLISNESLAGVGRGTGVLLDETHVLTCAHLSSTEDDVFLVYTYPLGSFSIGHVEGKSTRTDLAILVLDTPVAMATQPIFQEKTEPGEAIQVIGSALGTMQWFVTHGVISGHDHGFLLTDALINPGNSGGPWLNAKGEIVALTDWRLGPTDGVPGMAGGISAATINLVLKAREGRE